MMPAKLPQSNNNRLAHHIVYSYSYVGGRRLSSYQNHTVSKALAVHQYYNSRIAISTDDLINKISHYTSVIASYRGVQKYIAKWGEPYRAPP